ncbi:MULTISPECIES: NAD-dependent epimerase/dehydratase family protein [unclassified Rathayibacter]|uniref:NAD-dependent epimerase/dehydratase family protein n=1 Tax=unclassified Rathayibacter TaxID=2609250 RepID=UPI00188C9EBD|nr:MULTISPECIES: NAD(P)-dependent oxidoreductase [unclassified Rathayibacter]MBF4462969.1 NAD(P)-dependent oxidoreductase [Rathayibacter sp. VKM Ac-2879]MBF4504383.1 NAD(P)-dependent oxidoreductase [Rathayibacter sp. VKM Ac-2878]
MRIAVTGGSGKLGRSVVTRLRASGHQVVTLDRAGERGLGFVRIDITDYGQVVDALQAVGDQHDGVDALVHLAAIPAPGLVPDIATFHNNMIATFNAFHGAIRAGIRTIVYASSETVLGLPFDVPPPYIPVDEKYPARPETVYSLTKHLEEHMAIELCRWHPDLAITGLRFSNVMDEEDYAEFPSFDSDAMLRKWNLWAYIDGRDGAQAVEKALLRKETGFDRFIIAAADTVMSRPNAELVEEVFPGVEVRGDLGVNDTLLSIDHAREVLGFAPEHSWRDSRRA